MADYGDFEMRGDEYTPERDALIAQLEELDEEAFMNDPELEGEYINLRAERDALIAQLEATKADVRYWKDRTASAEKQLVALAPTE